LSDNVGQEDIQGGKEQRLKNPSLEYVGRRYEAKKCEQDGVERLMKDVDRQMPFIWLWNHVSPDRIIENAVPVQDISCFYQITRRVADKICVIGHNRILHYCRKNDETY
jgi:hypothetical protein